MVHSFSFEKFRVIIVEAGFEGSKASKFVAVPFGVSKGVL
jgi:hypothetical protein